MSDNSRKILSKTQEYYNQKVEKYGASSKGVDWNTKDSQELRFAQLLKVIKTESEFSIIDYGCGYGALYEYMSLVYERFNYQGIDVSPKMIEHATFLYGNRINCQFHLGSEIPNEADYIVSSGIFNVKQSFLREEWEEYVLNTLQKINSMSQKGFAFNCLTTYSDKHLMREDLYYADPCFLFDYCKRNFSKKVSLHHDYGLYEFTIIITK